MKKVVTIALISFICLLVGCKTIEGGNTTKNPVVSTPTSSATTSTLGPTTTVNDEEVEFVITLLLRGEPYFDPDYSEENAIEVIFTNSSTEKRVKLDENGVAKTTGLVGEFNVHLSKTPNGYTYDPNGTIVSNDNPIGSIELLRIIKLSDKNNSSIYNPIEIENITISDPDKKNISYCYIATLKNVTDIKYYQFSIKSPGSYTVESLVDVYENSVNPIARKYKVGPAAYTVFDKEIDDGGYSLSGGYTKNFKYRIDLDEHYIGNVAKFGIKADVKDSSSYPVTITFKITYVDTYKEEQATRNPVFANELYYKRDTNGNIIYSADGTPELNYVKITSDADLYYPNYYEEFDDTGNAIHYPYYWNNLIDPSNTETNSPKYLRVRYSFVNGQYVQDPTGDYILKETTKEITGNAYQNFGNFNDWRKGSNLVLDVNQNGQEVIYYNEEDGYYHFNYNGEDRIVCAKITSATVFVESALIHIEDPGNGALQNVSIDHKIYNYKRFIEAEYASVCNSDGVCYVTKELKEFLQYFSNSQCYFFDGNGWCEQDGVFAAEENQWLFACGFYKN